MNAMPALVVIALVITQPVFAAAETTVEFTFEKSGERLVASENPVYSGGSALSWDADRFYVGGKPTFIYAGEAHYFRMPANEWEERIVKMKNAGLNTVSTYVAWSRHEPREGVFDFSGQMDIGRFLGLCRKHGMYVHLRIGPYINAEMNHGGLPLWLYAKHPFTGRLPTQQFYLDLVNRFYGRLVAQVRPHFPSKGGNILLVQLDNEMAHDAKPEVLADGRRQMNALMEFATKHGFEGPFSATSWGRAAVADGALKLVGEYPGGLGEPIKLANLNQYDIKTTYGLQTAVFDAEHGGGTPRWGEMPARLPAAHAVAMMGRGVGAISYYMFGGGTNPQPYIDDPRTMYASPTTYDYSAPIGQFGQTRLSYLYCKRTGQFLKSYGASVQNGGYTPPTRTSGFIDKQVGFRGRDGSGFIYLSPYRIPDDQASTTLQFCIKLDGSSFTFPARSTLVATQCQALILPLRLRIDGLNLRYATAQPLTRLTRPEGRHLVFWGTGSVEYYLENTTKADILHATGVAFHQDGPNLIAVVDTAKRGNLFAVQRNGDKPVFIATLSESDALNAYQLEGVPDRLVMAPNLTPLTVTLAQGQQTLRFDYATNVGEQTVVSLYPGTLFDPANGSGGISDQLVRLQTPVPSLTFTKDSATFDASSIPANSKEFFLETTVMGHDRSRLLIDGTLAADHEHIRDEFRTLKPWRVGVKNLLAKRRYAWLIEQQGDGTVVIYNRNSKMAVTAPEVGAADGTPARQEPPAFSDTQKWKLVTADDGHVQLANTRTGVVLGLDGERAIVSRNVKGRHQMWRIAHIFDGYDRIINRQGGSLDVADGSAEAGALLRVAAREDSTVNLRFENISYASSYYVLESSLVLGDGPSPTIGTPIPDPTASIPKANPNAPSRPSAPDLVYEGLTWDFLTDLDGWSMNGSVSEHHIPLGSEIFFKPTGPDPFIVSPDQLKAPAATYRQLYLKLRNNTKHDGLRLYWVTESDGSYDEQRALSINITSQDTEPKEYLIDLAQQPNWKGIIRRLRLDLGDGADPGDMVIDKIVLTSKISTPSAK